MAKEFKFPDVGEGIAEGEVVRWAVAEGDEVKIDQALGEIETDKAVVEMPSPFAGTVLKLHFKPGDVVKVGQALVTIGEKGEAVPEAAAAAA
ncbi:MAG TPA: biotin/lipoyl-containing protein, partial [Acidobacteriota bacterium]|nr:biotin/lipoyl-containing protein [Acidobacteriota bacterium]